jgi:hypothetical protein
MSLEVHKPELEQRVVKAFAAADFTMSMISS